MYHKEVLDNGVRIVSEEIPYVRSVALGIWVGVGSRDETEEEHGISHFLEHLMFKGTEKRTAKEIAEALDTVGGQLNAFTTKEYTCYYAKVLDENIDLAIDVLSDMFFNSKFAEKDIEKEKKVVLEEIKMYEDSPDELVHDLFATNVWAKHTLGKPILGTADSVAGLNQGKVRNFYKKHYTTPNIVIAVAGKIKHGEIVNKLAPLFAGIKDKAVEKDTALPAPHQGVFCTQKSTEQLQLCIGVPGLP
ncbi:MAG: pitrilysin family protein, partial [Bacillota bacterium]|nr:pitrilysin family protein [Bacillota bacterium]